MLFCLRLRTSLIYAIEKRILLKSSLILGEGGRVHKKAALASKFFSCAMQKVG